MATNTDGREEIKPVAPTEQTKWRDPSLVGKYMVDPKTGLAGLFRSPDNGETWVLTDTVYGHVYNQDEVDNIWDNGAGHKVADEIKSATADLPNVRKQADEAVKFAESAIAASKVNSDAIVAQSSAVVEAKSAMDSATAEIQQTAANAASDAAKIRADVARVQNEVDTAKAANSASVEALKSDINTAKQDLANVHDSLDKAQAAAEQNQKAIDKSVAKITSDVSATKQDLATVHDSLTKAQAAAEQNQKLINDNVAKITSDVSATKQDLATVHDGLTKAQAAAEQNQKAIDKSITQINADITQDRKDIADVRQGLTKAQSDIIANQKAVNDNVAQINSDIEQDRKDIASAQQANADTVKQLDAYSKQAQEQGKTIKAVQDKQDGFSATLADVQGNVSQVSDKVSDLSASLKDTQDNVASVKAQADQLSATLTDHSKSIAILTASAKELSSTLEDADGRLSKVEQTAQTNSSTLSDVQGDLSQVKQNATKLVSTLKDAQGNISTLQQKADSLSTQLASAQGDIATLQTGIDGVKAILTSHDKSIHTLQADSKSLKDSMVNAQGDISTLRKTATDVTSELEDHTGRLSKVEQTASKQETTLSNLQGNLSQVEQKADSNTTTISSINKNAMQDRGVITDTNTSFDSLTHLGTYSIKAIGLPKMPEQHYGTLAVSGSAGSGWISQQFVADTTGNVYTRVFSNNAWSAWKQGGSQDAINQVKQTADSNSATIRNVQGDVSTLKQTATGIKSTLASHEGDIHTLQADSKSLKDSMVNAQGDISTLRKTATDVTSELEDHTGRLSKVEQSAAKQATKLSDLQGNLSQVEQKADSNTATISSINKNAMQDRGVITDTKTSFDSLTQLGTYSIKASGLPKMPEQHYGTLVVSGSAGSGWLSQQFVADTTGNVYTRVFSNNAWSAWKQGGSQDAINQVKQTADSNSATIRNVQGDVSTLKQTATGIKSTLASHEGDIHTLQADSKSLKDSMTNAQGDISTLQKSATSLDSEMKDHAGRLSKVEQNAATQTTTLSDLQGNLTQVKQQADGLVTTLKDAQGSITQIQQKADGMLEQLKSAQGDIASLQTDVTGIKATLTDHEGDIHTLQADSKTLKDDMADAQGNISSLQKTSTSLVSEFRDHDGRISKVEQTANTLTNEFSDQQGHLNRVEQTAQGTQQTVANQQGQINTIKTDADGIHETLTGQGNQIANINVTLSGLNSKYEGVSGDLGKLKGQVTTNSTQITQNKQAIALKADQTTVNNLSGEVSQNKAQFTVQAGQISSKVSGMETSLSDTASKLNNLVTSGRNYIQNSKSITMRPNGTDNYDLVWYVYDDAFASNAYCHGNNKTRFSFYLTPSKALPTARTFRIYWRASPWNSFGTITVPANTTDTQYYELTMTTPTRQPIASQIFIRFMAQDTSDISYTITKSMLTIGDSFPDWSPAPEDTDAKITANSTAIDQTNQKISLKADQTEVDKIKNTATQNSSRLDVMAGEIQSKVTSTDVDNIINGKGYATTSTVQSLITQKAGTINESITNLEGKFNSSSSVNLAEKTNQGTTNWMCDPGTGATNLTEVNINGVRGVRFNNTRKTTSWWVAKYVLNLDYFEPNQDYIISFDIRTSSDNFNQGGMLNIARGDSSHAYLANISFKTNFKQNQLTHVSCTGHSYSSLDKNGETFYLNCKGLGQCDWVDIVNFKIARGKIDKGYSPAPSDNATVTQLQSVTASIDGLQGIVKNKADQSAVTQLANTYQIKLTGNLLASLGKKAQRYTVGNNTFFPFASIDVTKVTRGTVLTLSFDYSSDADCAFAPQLDGTPWVPWGDIKDNPISVKANVPGHYVKQITVGDDSWTKGTAKNIAIRIDNFGGTFTVSNLTLRSGDNVASTFDMLQYDMDLRVQKGELLSQINLTAGNTLIQSNKLYLDASSVVITGTAFIPSAAIASLSADKITTGLLNTNNINLGDGRTRLMADHDNFYIQPAGSASSNSGIRMGYDSLSFMTNDIPNGYGASVPYYSINYDGSSNGSLNIQTFDHINPGGATSTQNWYSMSGLISLSKKQIDFATNNNIHMHIDEGGVTVRPTLYFGNSTWNGTWAGFTRLDNSNTVEFNTGDNNGENFHVNSGARFMQYVYINGYARAQGWLTNSTLSKKTNIRKLDTQVALDKIRQDDQYLYEYKRNVAQGIYDPQASFIIDDVNDVSHYSVPREFIDQSGNYREPNVELAYLIAAFQEIDKQVQTQKEEIKELKEKLQHE